MNTFGLTALFVPVRLCGQHEAPILQVPVVLSPSLVAAGIVSPLVYIDILSVDGNIAGALNV